jgi:hypothetical protein
MTQDNMLEHHKKVTKQQQENINNYNLSTVAKAEIKLCCSLLCELLRIIEDNKIELEYNLKTTITKTIDRIKSHLS